MMRITPIAVIKKNYKKFNNSLHVKDFERYFKRHKDCQLA